jgi:hypothetical protein
MRLLYAKEKEHDLLPWPTALIDSRAIPIRLERVIANLFLLGPNSLKSEHNATLRDGLLALGGNLADGVPKISRKAILIVWLLNRG